MKFTKNIWILLVSFCFFVVICGALIYNIVDVTKRLREVNEQLLGVTSEKETLQKELQKLGREKDSLAELLQQKNTDIERLRIQLEDEERKGMESKQELAHVQQEIERVRGLLDQEQKEKTNLTLEFFKLKQEYEKTKEALEQAKALPHTQVTQDKGAVTPTAADTTHVGEQRGVEVVVPGENSGKVLTINRDYNFVVIDKGRRNHVLPDQIFQVYRDNALIGKIRIQKVYDSMSAADIAMEEAGTQIHKGDTVVG